MKTNPHVPKELLVAKVFSERRASFVILTNYDYAKLILSLPGSAALERKLFPSSETPKHLLIDDFELSSFILESHLLGLWAQIVNVFTAPDAPRNKKERSATTLKLPRPDAFVRGCAIDLKTVRNAVKTLPAGLITHQFSNSKRGPSAYSGAFKLTYNNTSEAKEISVGENTTFRLPAKCAVFYCEDELLAYLELTRGVGEGKRTGLRLLNTFTQEIKEGGLGSGIVWYG